MKLRINESQMLTEGPGAGYTINWTFDKLIKVNNCKVKAVTEDSWWGDGYFIIDFSDVDIDITVDVTGYWSYYYGSNEELSNVSAKITDLRLEGITDLSGIYDYDYDEYDYQEAVNALYNMSAEQLQRLINNNVGFGSFEYNYGGGYMHSTFDGQIAEIDETTTDDGVSFTAYIEDKEVNDWIDKCVLGENGYREYCLFDDNREPIDDEYFENEDEAIERADEFVNSVAYDGNEITVVCDYYTTFFNGDSDLTDSETVTTVYRDYDED